MATVRFGITISWYESYKGIQTIKKRLTMRAADWAVRGAFFERILNENIFPFRELFSPPNRYR
jgi:hypothetical protein